MTSIEIGFIDLLGMLGIVAGINVKIRVVVGDVERIRIFCR